MAKMEISKIVGVNIIQNLQSSKMSFYKLLNDNNSIPVDISIPFPFILLILGCLSGKKLVLLLHLSIIIDSLYIYKFIIRDVEL